MFPYTHICFARDVLGRLNHEIVLGAVFADTVICSPLAHEDTHRRAGELFTYLAGLGRHRDFALGALTHSVVPAGLDYYCDEKYLDYERGYAFETARPLVPRVISCCRLPEQMGWWKAHNFIEMSTELHFYRHHNESYHLLRDALAEEELISRLSKVLAGFYGVPAADLAKSFPAYGSYVLLDEVSTRTLAEKYNRQMEHKHDISIDVTGAAGLIEKGLSLIKMSLPEFWRHCTGQVKKLLAGFSKQ
ncbi:MAG: hypothetical protein ACOY4Q_06890 [Bacillota bacterium]